ncbi:hypothetical protein P4S83_08450 [Aneurinibacillus thermoaerophilus]|uniref:hypothetical protein n=1 Tax=Aneurinibacillus thermoaerophilus TaxID=143495 RepID=UPI002E242F5C|nr:hypothetical protein [Aneurinibacillus thermoaerophilus]MED0763835.1 hypothetical protein [Aneurinibacillus thermoaerophilus]
MTIRANALDYDMLILVGIGPKADLALERFLDGHKQKKPLIFRCEEVLVWDPYGSLARSILSALVRYSAIQEIWILGYQGEDATAFSILSENADKQTVSTATYLISHLSGLSEDRWFHVPSDESSGAWKTAHLLQNHPLLPRPVTVNVALLDNQNHLIVQE